MSRCKDRALIGPQCQLDEGHDGPHLAHTENGTRTWTTEGVRAEMRKWEQSGGGWE